MTTEQAKALQVELLAIVRRYNKDGAGYDDIAKVVMHVASVVAITAEMKMSESVELFTFLYTLSQNEAPPPELKN
jgi:hypothetical protein